MSSVIHSSSMRETPPSTIVPKYTISTDTLKRVSGLITFSGAIATAYLNPYATAFGTALGVCMPTRYIHYDYCNESEDSLRLNAVREIVISISLVALAYSTDFFPPVTAVTAALLGFASLPRIAYKQLYVPVSRDELPSTKFAADPLLSVEPQSANTSQPNSIVSRTGAPD